MPSSDTAPSDAASLDRPAGRPALQTAMFRALAVVGGLAFAAFWVWALFFASEEAINKIDDREWAARAEAICQNSTTEREALANYTPIRDGTDELILQRAEIIDQSTDILVVMLDDVVAVEPSDEKGRGVIPLWEDEYRTYLGDRRRYADELRETRENLAFYETRADTGIPISERLETFAADNEMSACAPPRDLGR